MVDLSGRSNDEIQIAYSTLQRNPERFSGNPEYKMALENEYHRRFRMGPRSAPAAAPTNVDANLDAAATPVTPDPVLKPKSPADDLRSRMVASGYTPREAEVGVRQEAGMPHAFQAPPSDETLRWGGAYIRDQERRTGAFNSSLDGIYERPEPVVSHSTAPAGVDTTYYDSVTGGLPGAVGVVIDGVFVPGRLNARGEVMTTIGDERRAKEAKADKEWKSQLRASIEEDKERYGWDKPFMLRSEGQIDAANRRRDAERRVRESPSNMLAAAQRYSESTGIPVAEALKLLEADAQRNAQLTADIAASPTDNDADKYAERDSIGAGRKQLAILSRQVAADKRRAAREKHSRNMQLVGGSQNMNPAVRARLGTLDALGDDSGMNDWQKMVLAETMLREPQAMTPLGANAVGAQNAMRMAGAEAFAGGVPGMLEARRQAERDKKRAEAYEFAVAERNRVHWDDNAPMDRALANKIRRRIAARFGPEYADVVDALPVEDAPMAPGS